MKERDQELMICLILKLIIKKEILLNANAQQIKHHK